MRYVRASDFAHGDIKAVCLKDTVYLKKGNTYVIRYMAKRNKVSIPFESNMDNPEMYHGLYRGFSGYEVSLKCFGVIIHIY